MLVIYYFALEDLHVSSEKNMFKRALLYNTLNMLSFLVEAPAKGGTREADSSHMASRRTYKQNLSIPGPVHHLQPFERLKTIEQPGGQRSKGSVLHDPKLMKKRPT